MKVGILTYHWVFNYGANLQTLSTIGYFRRKGHDPIVINWIPSDQEHNYLKGSKENQYKGFRDFQKQYYPLTRLCRDATEVASVIKENGIEKVFIGSDTLFILRKKRFSLRKMKIITPVSCEVFPNPFWGEFLDYDCHVSIVGFSIASLDSKAQLYKKEKSQIKKYIKRFDYLSVRDKATQDLVNYFTDSELIPEITPDPVFNFNRNFNVSQIEKDILKRLNIDRDYYLMNMPIPYNKKLIRWAEDMNKLLNKKGYDFIELPLQSGKVAFPIKQLPVKDISPLEWYILIKNSKGFIGGLMHPIVICIHNKIPFYSFDYYGMSKYCGLYFNKKTSKVFQLLEQCSLLKYYSNVRELHFRRIISPLSIYKMLSDYDYDRITKASEIMSKSLEDSLGKLEFYS